MGINTSRILIETLVRRAVREVQRSPERSTRNLVDLALHFSKGRFQRRFFEAAQTMLENERSPYYGLVQDIATHVDSERLVRFGMNVGYNSFVSGAKRIREIEEKQGFNIPWTVSLHLEAELFLENQEKYHAVIAQGEGLGIFTWMLFPEGQPQELLPLAFDHPDSAFLLFCAPEDMTPPFLEYASELDNLMTVVRYDEEATDACELLRESGLLYSLYFPYAPDDVERITSGELLYSAQQQHPVFTALLAGPGCSGAVQTQVHQYVEFVRSQQLFQTVPWEVDRDSDLVDGIISNDACAAEFDRDGSLSIRYEHKNKIDLNLLTNDLGEIFMRAFPKKRAGQGVPCLGQTV